MSVKCADIAGFIEEKAPRHLAEYWDNVGLIIGSPRHEVSRVMVCLDVTLKVVVEAVEKKADFILSHHPVIFKDIKSINDDDFKGKIIYELIKNGINVYSAHTNLDVAVGGINQSLAELLELIEVKNLNDYKEDRLRKQYGHGMVGLLEASMKPEEFIKMLKDKLNVKHLRLVGALNKEIRRVAVFCGSFDENWSGIEQSGADVLVTGDLKHHTAIDATGKGICIVDAGHYATERIIIPRLVKAVSKRFPDVDVFCSTVEDDPFKTV